MHSESVTGYCVSAYFKELLKVREQTAIYLAGQYFQEHNKLPFAHCVRSNLLLYDYSKFDLTCLQRD